MKDNHTLGFWEGLVPGIIMVGGAVAIILGTVILSGHRERLWLDWPFGIFILFLGLIFVFVGYGISLGQEKNKHNKSNNSHS